MGDKLIFITVPITLTMIKNRVVASFDSKIIADYDSSLGIRVLVYIGDHNRLELQSLMCRYLQEQCGNKNEH